MLLISGEKILDAAASAVKAGEEAVVAAEEKTQEVFNEYVRSIHSKMIAVKFIDNFFFSSGGACCSRYNKCCQRKSR